MGGTFDPIHHGHLVAASEVADRFALDEVIFVPTGHPWQKSGESPAEHRYLMTVIATAANPRFTVSRVDIDRPGPTYTKDTLADLRAARTGRRVVLHHRRRRAVGDHVVEGRRRVVRPGALHRRHPARVRPRHHRTARDGGDPDRGTGAGDLVDGLPGPGPFRRAGLVPRAGRRRPVHRQTPPLRRDRRRTAPTSTAARRENHDRDSEGAGTGHRGRPGRRRQAGERHPDRGRLGPAGHHRLLRHRHGHQRTAGRRHRRRGRGEACARRA